MTSIELTAPAKINLFLKVLGKRRDSYHDIHTLFERITLSDKIKITKTRTGITVVSDKPITRNPHDNIAYKAAELIMKHKKVTGGVRICINKRIPLISGLGGGSSDAASVLIGINKLYRLNISRPKLMKLGKRLGADVPFFLLEAPFAIGRSRGDKLIKADIKVRPWHLLVYPGPFKVSTGQVYTAFDKAHSAITRTRGLPASRAPVLKCLTRGSGGDKITLPKDLEGIDSMLHNDLGDIVAKKNTVIGKTIRCLVASLGKKVIVSGSGPSVFCLYGTRKEALKAKKSLFGGIPAGRIKLWQVFVVGTKV